MCRALQKRETAKLYIPAEVDDIVRGIYRDLGVTVGGEPAIRREIPENKIVAYPGHNYTEYFGGVPPEFDFDKKGYVNFFLDMTLSDCPRDFDKLKKAGFVFTGTKPLQTSSEYIIMHYTPQSARAAIDETVTLTAFDGVKARLIPKNPQGEPHV
jgi:hypothetical protein